VDIEGDVRDMVEKPIGVFCCYAREDHLLLLELKKHLTALQREGLITLWTDLDISPGEEWEREIQQQLDMSQIILLLISGSLAICNRNVRS
jgi:TIR domain